MYTCMRVQADVNVSHYKIRYFKENFNVVGNLHLIIPDTNACLTALQHPLSQSSYQHHVALSQSQMELLH